MLYIDYKSGLPIYEQVYKEIIRLAALGVLQPGAQLPSVRSVAAEVGVNPNTVQKAYAMLDRDGIIVSVPGRGSFLVEQDALVDNRKRAALDDIRQAVCEALQTGVSAQEILQMVNSCIEKGDLREESESK